MKVKVERAEFHVEAVMNEFDTWSSNNAYAFSREIRPDGLSHLYRAVNPPRANPTWPVEIGEAVHALRSSLEHLAWQLVIAGGGRPNEGTSFPILSRKPSRKEGLKIERKIPSGAHQLIEAVQPYNGTHGGRLLQAINALDIIDKHRELLVTVAAVGRATSYASFGPPPLLDVRFTHAPLEDGQIVAIQKFSTPQFEPYTELDFTPSILFGEGTEYEYIPVNVIVWGAISFLNFEFFPKFSAWVPYSSA